MRKTLTRTRGKAFVNNYNIINSSNANIVVNSSQVDINQTTQDKAKKIVNKIREAVGSDESVKLEVRKEILEYLTEIEAGIENNKAPKFAKVLRVHRSYAPSWCG